MRNALVLIALTALFACSRKQFELGTYELTYAPCDEFMVEEHNYWVIDEHILYDASILNDTMISEGFALWDRIEGGIALGLYPARSLEWNDWSSVYDPAVDEEENHWHLVPQADGTYLDTLDPACPVRFTPTDWKVPHHTFEGKNSSGFVPGVYHSLSFSERPTKWVFSPSGMLYIQVGSYDDVLWLDYQGFALWSVRNDTLYLDSYVHRVGDPEVREFSEWKSPEVGIGAEPSAYITSATEGCYRFRGLVGEKMNFLLCPVKN